MITILIGISGSGKTTLAKEMISKNKNLVRINRDDLRKTLFGVDQTDSSYYLREDFKRCENLITEVVEQMMYDSLNKGLDIVLDNTNLHKKNITEIIRKFNHLSSIEIVFLHKGDSHEEFNMIEDRLKKRFYGDAANIRMLKKIKGDKAFEEIAYLSKQWKDFQKLKKDLHGHRLFLPQTAPQVSFNKSLPKTYAFDIDGTLALKGDRDIFDDSKLHLDTEIKEVGDVLRSLHNSGYSVIFISGRQDSCYETTKQWLKDNHLWMETSELYMRKAKDQRPDYIIKEELIINEVAPKYNLIAVFDDRLQVSREYFRLGIYTFNVNQGFIQF